MDPASKMEHEVAPPPARRKGLAALLWRAAIFASVLAVATLSILVLVPDGNDYARATGLKEQRLMSLQGSKIVLVGGSNLAFGINSPLIESVTGCPVANMGMNGYFGVRYMLSQAEAGLREGDVAVIALEHDNFVKSVEGTPTDLLMIAKTYPRTMSHMTPLQLARAAATIPFVVRSKIDRLADDAAQAMYDKLFPDTATDDEDAAGVSIDQVESFAGFTPEGDLVSHLNITWPYKREQGLDLSALPVEQELMPLLRGFAERMNLRGVDVVFSYTPLIRDFHDRHATALERIDTSVRRELGDVLQVPSTPKDFVYEEDQFFDTVYHLNRSGRDIRSRRLSRDIVERMTGSVRCRGPADDSR